MAKLEGALLEYFRRLRDENLAHASKMEAGDMRMSERQGDHMVDTTAEWAAELRRRAAGLDKIISVHEKPDA